MSTVRFAELCDKCRARSDEYQRWNTCILCGDDTCPKCDVDSIRDDEFGKTLCLICFTEMNQ